MSMTPDQRRAAVLEAERQRSSSLTSGTLLLIASVLILVLGWSGIVWLTVVLLRALEVLA